MRPLRHLRKYFSKYRSYLCWGFLFVTLSNLFGIYPAQAVRVAFDMVSDSIMLYRTLDGFKLQQSSYDLFVAVLLYFAVLILVFNMIKGIFMYFMRQTLIVMSRHIEYELKNEIFSRYQQLPLSFYRRNNTGDLMARISEDVSRVRMYAGPAIMYTMNLVVTSLLVIGIMLSVNVKLTLYVLIPLPFLSASIYYVNSIINRKSDAIQAQLSTLTTFVQESFSGIRVIKAFAAEDAMFENFKKETEQYKVKSLALARVDSLFFPLMMLLIGMSTLITIYAGGMEVIKGNITTGNIAEFVIYVTILTWPFIALGWVTSIIQRASASQQRINEFLALKPEVLSDEGAPFVLEKEIEFRDVSFRYTPDGAYALSHISFKLPKGKTLAIIGNTGSGKSTVATLLSRMFDITEGSILVDGKELGKLKLDELRQKMAYVPQDVFLFSDTIYNNISFGYGGSVGDAGLQQKVEEAARMASVEQNILSFPQGYQTEIGERGITLSGGQKQRISIARALMRDPEILVLDDCLSAVDTITEAEIMDHFRKVFMGRSVLIISHRVSAVKAADHILLLEEGKIVEEGRHEDLMKLGGRYFQLYEKQLKEKPVADLSD